MTLKTFVAEASEAIERLETAGSLAWWNLATTGDEKYAEEMKAAKVALRKLFSSSEGLNFLNSQTTEDPQLQRQVTILLHSYRENQISQPLIQEMAQLETAIETVYTNFRPIVKGVALSNNALKKVLVESSNSKERQEAWESSKLIGEQVESDVKKLISLRNASATEAGFSNYYSMRLELQELDEARLFTLLEELEKQTEPLWKNYKKALDVDLALRYGEEPKPWHYQDPFFQEAPREQLDLNRFYEHQDLVAIVKKYFESISFEIADILDRSDLFDREKKNQHAFCNCIDRKQDIRILCNMQQNEYWMGTLLHEMGHAVYDKYIDQRLPYLLRAPAHTSTTEASAMLFGRLSKDGAFLQAYCGQSAEEIESAVQRQTRANLLVFARWTLVMIHFERAMYQQSDLDLNRFWWQLVERFQGVKVPTGRNKPDWAAKLHLASAPVYYQNYILGEMTASQLLHFLQRGEALKTQLYHSGAQFPWEETLQKATGENLNPAYFVADITS